MWLIVESYGKTGQKQNVPWRHSTHTRWQGSPGHPRALSRGGDGPLPDWLAIEEQLGLTSNVNPQVRRMQRLLIGHATECELDASGRILLPAPLREYARLDKGVMFVGQGRKFEIWDEREWITRRAEWQAQGMSGALPPELGSLSL